ncbi:MAG: [FeFe] hydrogenase H-cluster radical SAM maturase HydE [Roseburia sp.]|nr:[FeFe] hydrogenase H-cluster radical SAM maturase HydE [Roseburia sp.]
MKKEWIDRLAGDGILKKEEFVTLLSEMTEEDRGYAAEKAADIAKKYYGNKIYVRGLIEFTNICQNDCYYCGIRRSNRNVCRYRLNKEEILLCCREGYRLGFRTFVLQGGEDGAFTDEVLTDLIKGIKKEHPDCAVTLSVGERSAESYRKLREAGADRYLLRHETADRAHYEKLHPPEMSFSHRRDCIGELKALGYQTGCGFMVGSPYQTYETIADDLFYIHEVRPEMVGIGPFLPQKDTPFHKEALDKRMQAGEEIGLAGLSAKEKMNLTVFLLSLIRIMEKDILLPATTALATIDKEGRKLGVLAGANVIMPNLSPLSVRDHYTLYDNKANKGDEAAEGRKKLEKEMASIGYEVVTDIGNVRREGEKKNG